MDDFENMSEEEKLKAENDFLKMKMMLERGAEFHTPEDAPEISSELENKFLRDIIEFEKQFEQDKRITIYDKVGRPTQFKPVNEIPDSGIDDAWYQLHHYMFEHGIEISALSPKVTVRELYRFTTEELFDHETEDINIPDMISGFIYDEFYPDYEYENTNAAVECLQQIFKKSNANFQVLASKITLNTNTNISPEDFKMRINQFKDAFDELELHNAEADSCVIEEITCTIKGMYAATGFLGHEKMEWNDAWTIIFQFDDNLGYWEIVTVLIQNINF